MSKQPVFGKRGEAQRNTPRDNRIPEQLTAEKLAELCVQNRELESLAFHLVNIRTGGKGAASLDSRAISIALEQINRLLDGLSKKKPALSMKKYSITPEEFERYVQLSLPK